MARVADFRVLELARSLAKDPDPAVRREVAVSLRRLPGAEIPMIWAELARRYRAPDRWYLESLGVGAATNWDACLAAFLGNSGPDLNQPEIQDLIWRSRATATPGLLAKLVLLPGLSSAQKDRFMRAFDFQSGPEKDKALEALALRELEGK